MRNRLLLALSESERAAIISGNPITEFARGEPLLDAERPVQRVVFPETMFASQIVTMADGSTVEVGTIGSEGVVGLTAGVGPAATSWSVVCQIAGEGYAIDASAFDGLAAHPSLERVLGTYTHAVLNQIAQTAACNRLHGVEHRAARWLLTSRDRIGSERFRVTEEYLATMLGVSRTTVSTVAQVFARAHLVAFRHGVVTIEDPARLELVVCECYQVIRRQFDELTEQIGPSDLP